MKTKFIVIVLLGVLVACHEKVTPVSTPIVEEPQPIDSIVVSLPVLPPSDSTKKEGSLVVLGAEFVRIPDSYFESRLVQFGVDSDKIIDGKISRSDAEKTDTLIVSGGYGSFIKSLKGIESFKNLVALECRWNELDTLDLSQNTKLEYLDCSGMNGGVAFAQYDTYNVRRYIYLPKSLKVLDAYLTSFTNLNSQDLTNLEFLRLHGGNYNKIDLAKCNKLKEFQFYPNSKTTVCVNSLDQVTDKWTQSDKIEYKVCN